jgi:hypothetical protein
MIRLVTSLASTAFDRDLLRHRSKVLFGNADRLEVAIAVARSSSGVVHAKELANELNIDAPRVRTQLRAFVEAGVMVLLPRHGQTVDYERRPDPFWAGVETIVTEWGAL